MKDTLPRWRDMHPGDIVFERLGTFAALQHAADAMQQDGYKFRVEPIDNIFMVTCLGSPRPLIEDRP